MLNIFLRLVYTKLYLSDHLLVLLRLSYTRLRITALVYRQNPEKQNPEWTKFRIGQNPELDEIPNWTKSRMEKIQNEQNPESNQLQK